MAALVGASSYTPYREHAMMDRMLEMKTACEECARALPPDSTDAMICSYECTFCRTCVETVLANQCPNCGGGFERRPTRQAG
jgi:hypothetical protein